MSTSVNPKGRQSGFTLFPTPPTPPVRANRSPYRSRAISRRQSSIGTLPSLSETSAYNVNKIEEEQIREDIPPVPSLLPTGSATSSSQDSSHASNLGRSDAGSPQQYSVQTSKRKKLRKVPASIDKPRSFRALFPWSSSKTVEQNKPLDGVGIETHSTWRVRKKSFGQLSQMFDAEIGEVDQKKLSTYLGNILDTSFKTPDLIDVLEPNADSEHTYYAKPGITNLRNRKASHAPSVRLSTDSDVDCVCYPTTVICQCSSSTEFKTFQEAHNYHKQQASISSTACFLGIPRARFSSAVPCAETPGATGGPLLSSPPGLSYSSSGSRTTESSIWSIPGSPTAGDDPFASSPNALRSARSHLMHTKRILSTGEAITTKRISDSQSFSRPFVEGRPPSIACSNQGALQNPPSSQTWTSHIFSAGSSEQNYLGNRDTMSTFDFDFKSPKSPQRSRELAAERETRHIPQPVSEPTQVREPSRRQTVTKSCGSPPSRIPRWSSCSAQAHSHKRSNSSTCSSLFEVIESANTAIVARARSAKAVVVMHRQTQNSSTGAPPLPSVAKSAYWQRMEREQQEQLKKLQKVRLQQYQPRNSVHARNTFRRSVYCNNPAATVRPDNPASTPPRRSHGKSRQQQQQQQQQQRYSEKVELGPSAEDDANEENYRAKTSDGSPVTGRARLTIVRQ